MRSAISVGLAVLLGCSTASHDSPGAAVAAATLYIVRHAEKVDHSDASALTPLGRRRAAALSTILADVELDAIYSTRFLRTKLTVAPTAKAKGLTVTPKTPTAAQLRKKVRNLYTKYKRKHPDQPEGKILLGVLTAVMPTLDWETRRQMSHSAGNLEKLVETIVKYEFRESFKSYAPSDTNRFPSG